MLAANDRDVAVKDRVTSAIKEWCKGLNGVTSIDFSIPDGVVYVKLISKAKAGEGKIIYRHVFFILTNFCKITIFIILVLLKLKSIGVP